MIEAVNSVLSNAQIARGNAEQASTSRNLTANPERVQEIAKAPYVSPYISLDLNYDRAVLQLRDSDTGDVLRQYPSESQMEAYRRAQAASERREAAVIEPSPQPQQTQQAQTPVQTQQVEASVQTQTADIASPQTTTVTTEA